MYSHVYAVADAAADDDGAKNIACGTWGECVRWSEDAPFDDAPNRMRIITTYTHAVACL